MTSKNVKKVQILAELDNGEFLMAVSDSILLINFIVEFCKFIKIDKSAVGEVDVKEITKGGEQ